MASLQTIFNSFDLDGNGFIQIKQLKQVAKKLGDNLSDKELQQLMLGIDINQDGKISFKEFSQWWLKGHKGKLNKLVYLKAKSLKMTNFIKQQFSEAGINLENYKHSDQIDKHSFSVSFGNASKEGIGLSLNCFQQGQKYQQKLEQLKKKNQMLDQEKFTVMFSIPSKKPKELKQQLQVYLLQILDTISLNSPISISSLQDNDFVQIKLIAIQNQVILHVQAQKQISSFLDQIVLAQRNLVEALGQKFYFHFAFQIKTNFTVDELIQSKSLFQCLLNGFCVNAKLQMTSSALSKLKQLGQKLSEGKQSFLLGLLLRKSNFNLKIRSPSNLQNFFQKLGIFQLINTCPSFGQLLYQFGPELCQMKKSVQAGDTSEVLPFFELIYKLSRFSAMKIQSGVSLYFIKKGSILSIQTSGKGTGKIHQILFDQQF